MSDEWETGQPGRVEAGRTDDDVYIVCITLVVNETTWCDFANGIGKDSHVRRDQGLKIAWRWCGSATAYVEVLWYHLYSVLIAR